VVIRSTRITRREFIEVAAAGVIAAAFVPVQARDIGGFERPRPAAPPSYGGGKVVDSDRIGWDFASSEGHVRRELATLRLTVNDLSRHTFDPGSITYDPSQTGQPQFVAPGFGTRQNQDDQSSAETAGLIMIGPLMLAAALALSFGIAGPLLALGEYLAGLAVDFSTDPEAQKNFLEKALDVLKDYAEQRYESEHPDEMRGVEKALREAAIDHMLREGQREHGEMNREPGHGFDHYDHVGPGDRGTGMGQREVA
jgi:hypothetical protein